MLLPLAGTGIPRPHTEGGALGDSSWALPGTGDIPGPEVS